MSSHKRVLEEAVQVIPRYTGDPARTYKPDYHPRYKPRSITYVPMVGVERKAPPPSPYKGSELRLDVKIMSALTEPMLEQDVAQAINSTLASTRIVLHELLKSGVVEQHGSWFCLPGTAPEGLRKKPAPLPANSALAVYMTLPLGQWLSSKEIAERVGRASHGGLNTLVERRLFERRQVGQRVQYRRVA